MLGYYPAISVFRGGAAEVNFGPPWWYDPPGWNSNNDVNMEGGDQPPASKPRPLRAVAERYDEQIVEDIVYDIIDEVDFWMQDGGGTGKGAVADLQPSEGGAMQDEGLGGAGIREIMQDDE